jgi:hypothetical protein
MRLKGFKHSEETKEKIRIRLLGIKRSEETKKKISLAKKEQNVGENNPFYGKRHTAETKRKIGLASKSRPSGKKGKKLSAETKKKISLNHADVSGKNNPHYGKRGKLSHWYKKKHKVETIKKMAECKLGENNPSWIDGRSYLPYPQEFNEKLRNRIRKRDNYKCKNCGMEKKAHIKKYRRNLEIHHIDYDSQNCEEKNLITLCKDCNLKANKKREFWKKYYQRLIKVKLE